MRAHARALQYRKKRRPTSDARYRHFVHEECVKLLISSRERRAMHASGSMVPPKRRAVAKGERSDAKRNTRRARYGPPSLTGERGARRGRGRVENGPAGRCRNSMGRKRGENESRGWRRRRKRDADDGGRGRERGGSTASSPARARPRVGMERSWVQRFLRDVGG